MPSRRPQDLSGPLSSMTKVEIKNLDGIIRNLHAKNVAYQKQIEAVVTAYGHEAERDLAARTPVDLGNMKDRVRLRFTEKRSGWSVGWHREDFLRDGLRWYVPYVLFGTSTMPARPVHLETEAVIRPRFTAALRQALRDTTERRG